jgi:hypothetical protein
VPALATKPRFDVLAAQRRIVDTGFMRSPLVIAAVALSLAACERDEVAKVASETRRASTRSSSLGAE